jgi:hypothetical protein
VKLVTLAEAAPRLSLAILASLLVVLVLGGIPGASLHGVVADLVAPPVPAEVKDRDGALDVAVVDGAGGPPVAGAYVRALALIDGRAYLGGARETDAAGLAHLAGLPRAETWVLADAPGRARASTRLVLEAGTRAVTLELGPEHTFEVAVVDELGAAIAGAEIEVLGPSEPLPVGARTRSDGTAHVARLGAGPWRVTARATGYEEASARVARDGDRVQLVARKLGGLDVTVLGPDELAVVGARVEVAGAMLWPPRAATTGPQGDVAIGGLQAGSYALRATAGERVSAIELGVALARGERKSVALHLAAGRFAAVLVTDGDADDAAPVASARVSLAEGGLSPFPLEATTDGKGRARLGPFAPGFATLSARADGFMGRGGMPLADPPPAETRIALMRAGTLTGKVVDARGYPVDGATLEIVGTDPGGAPIFDDPRRASFSSAHFDAMLGGPAPMVPMGELGVMPGPVPAIPHEGWGSSGGAMASRGPRADATVEPWVTRDDGTFRASPASPGRVRVVVHHPQFVDAQSDVVTLAPGGEAHVDIVMHAGGTLEGRVVDARDRAVEGARVLVSATRGTLERTTRTASDGTFAFASLPDEVVLTAGVDDDDAQPDARVTVTIPEGGRQQITVHLPEAREPLPVKVVDDRDFPVDAAQVSASSLAADVLLRATAFTGKDGTTALKRARGVPLRVEVTAPGRAPRVLTTDGTETELAVTLAAAESATGEVVTARRREAIAGAEVTLYTDLGTRRAHTDASGAFSLSGLGAGAARLRVRVTGYAPAARDVTIPDSGGRRALEIPRVELAEEGAVEGDVVDGRGDPIAGVRVAKDQVPTWLAVGATPQGIALTDARGRFTLRELPEGTLTLEAYAPDVGRTRLMGVKVVSGRTTTRVRITLVPGAQDGASGEPGASGNVAVTLGETGAPVEVAVVSVSEGSEAERAGLLPGDVLVSVDGAAVSSMEAARARLAGPVADDVVLVVRRADQTLTLRVSRETVRR